MMKTGSLIVALAFASAAAPHPDESDARSKSERVSYADLDLGGEAGQAVLRHRIQVAAGDVCDLVGLADVEQFLESEACYRAAIASGNGQMRLIITKHSSGVVGAASAIVISAQ